MIKVEKIKPLVSEYAANLSMLFVTPLSDEVKTHITFLNFLFSKKFYIHDGKDTYNVWKKHSKNIDIVIVHINGDIQEHKKLVQKIRQDDANIIILVLVTENEQIKKQFNISSCYCADGFLPSPFEKDELYKFLYRFLKRIAEHKELEEYVNYLESAQAEQFFPETSKLMKAEESEKEEEKQKSREVPNTIKVKEDIRFNQGYKMSAHELMEELDSTIVDKAEEFLASLENYSAVIYNMQEMDGKTAIAQIDSIIDTLSTFSYIVDTLSIFPIIVRAFNDLVSFLRTMSAEQLDDYEKKALLLEVLSGLGNDLESWIINIFQEQSTDDIHYLDASFANNTLELEALFNEVSIESDEDDLEFF